MPPSLVRAGERDIHCHDSSRQAWMRFSENVARDGAQWHLLEKGLPPFRLTLERDREQCFRESASRNR